MEQEIRGCYSLEIEKPRVTGGDCAVFRNNERSIMEAAHPDLYSPLLLFHTNANLQNQIFHIYIIIYFFYGSVQRMWKNGLLWRKGRKLKVAYKDTASDIDLLS